MMDRGTRRPCGFGRRAVLALVALVIAAGATAGLLVATAAATVPPCTDNFTGSDGGDWGNPGNWTLVSDSANQVPGPSDVACWPTDTTVTVESTDTDTADSIQGGDLVIEGASTLTLMSGTQPSSLVDLTLDGGGGELDGAGQTLSISDTFTWGASDMGAATLNNTAASPDDDLAISAGTLTMDDTSTPTFDGGSVAVGSAVSLSSNLTVSSGTELSTTSGAMTVSSDIGGSGATFSAAGGVVAGITGPYGFGSNTLDLTGGTTDVAGTNTLDAGSVDVTGGTLEGTGTIDANVTNTSGTVSPGDGSPGILTVSGDYTQDGGGTLAIEIAGTTAGTDGFGQLAVGGTASLDGDLSLTDSSFTPTAGDTFEVLTSTGGDTGTFTLDGTNGGTYSPEYHADDVTLAVLPTGCTASNPDIYTATSGNWSTADNWSLGAVPTSGEVACWASGTTVTVSTSGETADSIQGGGDLDITGGVLTLAGSDTSSIGALSLEGGGELDGPSGQTVDVAGDFDWGGSGTGTAGLNVASDSALSIDQAGGQTLTIDGSTSAPTFDGGSITTASPVSITNSSFQGGPGTQLTATGQALTLGSVSSGVDLASGSGGTIEAAGIVTLDSTGTSTVTSFALHLTTGASSSLEPGSTLEVENLTTDSSTTLPVPTGSTLNVFGGAISGTIDGAGAFAEGIGGGGGTTTIESSGTLSTSTVDVPSGTLDVNSGATFSPATATSVTGGVLDLDANGSTGSLSLEGGQLNGAGGDTLSVSGAFDWGSTSTGASAGALNEPGGDALAISQTGGGSFAIDSTGTSTPHLDGGSISTTSPVSITSPAFDTSGTPTLSTTSTITLGSSVAFSGTGATFSAAGLGPATGLGAHEVAGTYNFGSEGLTLTGGSTTVESTGTLDSGPLQLTDGTVQDDGTVHPSATTLAGGTLDGIGTVDGNVTNTSGTVSPGDAAPGKLTITGNYSQDSGGTLAIELEGTTAGAGGFGQLIVDGSATISGDLSVSDETSFAPTATQTFEILTSSTLGGSEFTQLSGSAASTYFAQYSADDVTLAVPSASCPSTNFDAYAPPGGSWSTAGNWSTGSPPAAGQVACWTAGTTVTVSDSETATQINSGGDLSITSGGTLTVGSGSAATDSTVGALSLEGGGELDGPDTNHTETLDVAGAFDWGSSGSGTALLNHSTGSNLEVIQPANQTLSIGGSGTTPALDGGSVLTDSPASITNSNFEGASGTTFTTTQALTLGTAGSSVDLASGTGGTIVAGGIDTLDPTGTSTVTSFALHLTTGASSSLEAGSTLDVENLTTDSGTTLPVPSGATLGVVTGAISGTIDGAGTLATGFGGSGATTTIEDTGTLSSAVDVDPGSLTVESTAGYAAASTSVGAGTLTLDTSSGTTGALSLTGGGEIDGVSGNTLTASGNVTWSSGVLSQLALDQSGSGLSFSISGTAATSLIGSSSSITTNAPVSLTSTDFATSGTPTVDTSSTLTLGSSVTIGGSGATFLAAGLGSAGTVSTTYDFGVNSLILTGGSTTVQSSGTVDTGPLSLDAGTLEDDGTIVATGTTLSGGTLDGTGTVDGAVSNESATISPGDGTPGVLTLDGNYSQGGGATLAIELAGTTAGSGFGQLEVSGTAAVGGDLSLSDVNGFVPGSSETFEIVSSGGARTGALTLTGPSANLYVARYDAKDVTLATNPTPANITAPTITGTPSVGQTLNCSDGTWSSSPTIFTFQWNRNGSPIAGATAQTYVVSTADRGEELTCTVVADNGFPSQPATSAAVSVPAPPTAPVPPFNITPPSVSGTPAPGDALSCSTGAWFEGPTAFTYLWERNGTAIAGATASTYTVQIADENAILTCTVTASNAGGAGSPKASLGVLVAKAGTLTCPKPTGKLSGRSLGPLQLGFKRSRARGALKRHTAVGSGQDDFCLYGGWNINAGYPSAKLLRTISASQRGRLAGRVVLALTSNLHYALSGARPGMALSAVSKRLHLGKVIRIGANSWYVAPGSVSRGVLRVRGGIIQEVGIATEAFTNTRGEQRRFLGYFNGA